MEQTAEKTKMEEVTLKFGKGCVGEPFTGKDGKEYKQILIPNKDENDHTPWATFVVKANAVHEDKFGKGMWLLMDIPQCVKIIALAKTLMGRKSGRLIRPRFLIKS